MIFILECLPAMGEFAADTQRPFIMGISDKRKFERLG